MTESERAVCQSLGITEADYVKTKRARQLGISVSAASGMGFGMDAVREMMDRMRQSGEITPDADPDALRAEAEEARAVYQDSGDWHDAARAICFDLSALDGDAPGYAERHGDRVDDDDAGDEGEPPYDGSGDERGGNGAAEARLKSPFGAAHARGPLMSIFGDQSRVAVNSAGHRADGLTPAERAVCGRMNITASDFLRAKAARQ